MTDDASLTDFFEDSGSDEGGEDSGSATSEPASDIDSDGDSPDDDTSDDTAAEDTPTEDIPTDGSAEGTGSADDDGRVPPETVESATATASWSLDGAACEGCGAVVSYRWRGTEGLVCPDCKEW